MFAESIEVILAIWENDPPYNIDFPNNRWKISNSRTFNQELSLGWLKKPFQKPRPEIVGTVVAPHSKGVIEMGKRDFHPLSANFLMSYYLKSHWDNYVQGKAAVGITPPTSEWRVARTIFVADDDKTAARYGIEDENSPYKFYYRQLYGKMSRGPRIALFKASPDQRDEDVSIDGVLDRLVLHGSVNKVVDKILALREEIGDFGELVYAGMDWVDKGLANRSMQLLAEEVMPRVNAAIKKSATAA
jgi:alkanesulfonate monooxygenase SsuD/methylene tetrahydromethanopterin reductase-like flavin-dependent oxidoreductase (luciferase family)